MSRALLALGALGAFIGLWLWAMAHYSGPRY